MRELVAPELADEHIVSLGEGNSPLVASAGLAEALGVPGELYVKLCGQSPTGSFKDLGMTVLVSTVKRAIALGRPLRAIVCASTGDTSAALAGYAAAAGLRAVVLLPHGKISTAQLLQPLTSGAKVLALETDFDGCMRIVRQLAQDESVYLANSMNPVRLEGQKTVAIELLCQLGWDVPDWVVVPGGNLGNAGALHRGFTLARDLGLTQRLPRLVVAQAAQANPLYRAAANDFRQRVAMTPGETSATAIRIGDPVSWPRAIRALRESNGVVEQASEQELSDAAAVADRAGIPACPHTGVALAAVASLARRGVFAKGERVAVISTASSLKFTEFKVAYHEATLAGVSSSLRSEPVRLPADLEAVRAAAFA
jgi:threonine synthase